MSNPNRYPQGSVARLRGEFTDPENDNAPMDPFAVSLSVLSPSGTLTTYIHGTHPEVQRLDTGIYFADIPLTEPGSWYYRWFSTGTGQAAAERRLIVDKPKAA